MYLHQLIDLYSLKKIRRKDWDDGRYIRVRYDDTQDDHIIVNQLDNSYTIGVRDLLATDWEEYNSVGYVALYMRGDGIPGHYVISEEEYNNKRWPDFQYMTNWLRFDSEGEE